MSMLIINWCTRVSQQDWLVKTPRPRTECLHFMRVVNLVHGAFVVSTESFTFGLLSMEFCQCWWSWSLPDSSLCFAARARGLSHMTPLELHFCGLLSWFTEISLMRTAKEYVPGNDLSNNVAFFTISVRKHVSDASDQWNIMIFTTFLLARDTKCSDHLN